ncbi:MAG: MarR family transcriptional regulator [Actinobacteria bacterium]|nr:MarR family transcriptional regulator [Actinomycetota bacterium]MSX78828.1 MarR family transcriptional regulator [Actinomycetota bacterium]
MRRRAQRDEDVALLARLLFVSRRPTSNSQRERGLVAASKAAGNPLSSSYKLRDIIQFVDKSPTPSLLPIFRSQQQAELLAVILGDPTAEHSMTELAERTGVPYASVHREVERADAAGLVSSRLVGRTRLIRADVSSPYFAGLSDVLVKAFGVPWVIGQELARVEGIDAAYVYGSWAARFSGEDGDRPVGDIDLLVLGELDRDEVYAAASAAEHRLGRAVQVTIRSPDWLTNGSGTFHDTVAGRPMVPVPMATRTAREDQSPTTAQPPRRDRRN